MPTEDDTATQQVAKEEKPDVQIMQIVVRAQVNALLKVPHLHIANHRHLRHAIAA